MRRGFSDEKGQGSTEICVKVRRSFDECRLLRTFAGAKAVVGKKTMKERSKIWGHVVAIGVVLIWGVTFINTKVLLGCGLSPIEIFVIRFVLAYACIWCISERRLWCSSWRDELLMLALGVTGGSLYFAAENEALRWTMASNVSFIVCSAPLWTILLALMLFRDVRATLRLFLGSLLALVGMAAIIFNGHFVLHLSPRGDLLALAAALCWAGYSILIRSVSGRYSAVFITRKVFAYGLLTIAPVFVWQPWQFPLSGLLQTPVWTNLLFLGLIASFACFVLWSWAVKEIGALSSSNYIYLNPVATCIASALILSEPITPIAILGLILILVGVYLAEA